MRRGSLSPDSVRNLVFFLIAAVIVAADQLSKAYIRSHLAWGQVLFDSGLFQILNIQNTGAAFGIFPNQSPVLAVVSMLGVIIVLTCALYLPRHISFLGQWAGKAALGMVLGGTLGNLIDRLSLGYVTDFISFTFWPAFNIADASVTVGALWLGYLLLSQNAAKPHADG